MAFKTHNKSTASVGDTDSATRRLLASASRAAQSDKAFLGKLPAKFTAEQARIAWGYTRVNNAQTRINLLEEAGLVKVWTRRYEECRCCGRKRAINTWVKVAQ